MPKEEPMALIQMQEKLSEENGISDPPLSKNNIENNLEKEADYFNVNNLQLENNSEKNQEEKLSSKFPRF